MTLIAPKDPCMSYIPEPNSVAARVIAYLGSKPEGYAATNAELAHQLGVPPSSFRGCLTASINACLVASRMVGDSGRTAWTLGAKAVRREQPAGDGAAWPPTGPAPTHPPPAEPVPTAPPLPDPVTAEIKALLDAAAPEPFACALFNDGRLYIELGSETMTLQVEHTRELMRYLDQIARS